jgi:hypothetical protein
MIIHNIIIEHWIGTEEDSQQYQDREEEEEEVPPGLVDSH